MVVCMLLFVPRFSQNQNNFVDLDAVKPIGSNFFRENVLQMPLTATTAPKPLRYGDAWSGWRQRPCFPQLRLISFFFRFEGILRGGNFLIFCFVGGWDVFFSLVEACCRLLYCQDFCSVGDKCNSSRFRQNRRTPKVKIIIG